VGGATSSGARNGGTAVDECPYHGPAMVGKYRLRTRVRGVLPLRLAWIAPKGRGDCGCHEWYRAEQGLWRCYHCEAGVTRQSPFTVEEEAVGRIVAIGGALAALLGDPSGVAGVEYRWLAEELAAEARRLESAIRPS
jgi:hypothetical protein